MLTHSPAQLLVRCFTSNVLKSQKMPDFMKYFSLCGSSTYKYAKSSVWLNYKRCPLAFRREKRISEFSGDKLGIFTANRMSTQIRLQLVYVFPICSSSCLCEINDCTIWGTCPSPQIIPQPRHIVNNSAP